MAITPTVYVIDDDPSVLKALSRLLRVSGLDSIPLPSIASFMESDISDQDACVLADIRLENEDGLVIPRLLAERGLRLPVIFLTAVDTKEVRSRARQAGAAAFFRKPVDDQALIDAIRWALGRVRQ
jgi:FixJ family two-component response regulator